MSHIYLATAMVCVNCSAVFAPQRACPACTSAAVYSIEAFLMRRGRQQYEQAVVAELATLHAAVPK